MIKAPIVHEDEDVVIICKSPGLVSVRASTVKDETVQDWMDDRLGDIEVYRDSGNEIEEYFYERKGIVHRLDKETSGVMILSKNPDAFEKLLKQFKERKVKKTYLALTHGIWKVSEGSIVLPVSRMRHNRKKFGVGTEGKGSRTDYKVLKRFKTWALPKKVDDTSYQGFSLVEFSPRTGRTHQLRVHSRHIGHPIVGDYLYSGKKRTRKDRKWAKRTMLHAYSIGFFHPRDGKWVEYKCVSSDFLKVLSEYFGYHIK